VLDLDVKVSQCFKLPWIATAKVWKTISRKIKKRIYRGKKLARRKALRRKYKHFTVALSGAAIMAGNKN